MDPECRWLVLPLGADQDRSGKWAAAGRGWRPALCGGDRNRTVVPWLSAGTPPQGKYGITAGPWCQGRAARLLKSL